MTTLISHLAIIVIVCVAIGEILVFIERRKPFKK